MEFSLRASNSVEMLLKQIPLLHAYLMATKRTLTFAFYSTREIKQNIFLIIRKISPETNAIIGARKYNIKLSPKLFH